MKKTLIDIYVLSGIHFSLPLNPAIQYIEWKMHQRFCVADVENKKILNPILYLFASSPKLL